MNWEYEWNGDDAQIYDHNGEAVTKAINSDPPSKRIGSDGVPKDPDVRGAICDYICNEIDSSDFPSDEAKHDYVETAQTVLAAGLIERRAETE